MIEDFLVVAGSVVTLFLMMGVGFFFGKKGMLSSETLSQLSALLLYVVCPAIMIDTFLAETCDGPTVRLLLVAGGALVGTYVLNMLLIPMCFRRMSEEDRGVMRFGSIYGNTGFMGIPLISAVLGAEGMLPTVTSLAVFNISIWTHGAFLMEGRRGVSLKKALCNPGVIGFVIAVALFALGVELPGPAETALGYIGDLNTPLAMIVVGAQMAAVDLPTLFRDRRLYWGCGLKLLVVPTVTMLVLLPFHLDRVTFTAIAILAGCPAAGATSLFSQMAGRDPSLAARVVTLSTLLCIVTLPLVALLAQAVC